MYKPKFALGQIVFLKTDDEQEEYIVTGFIIRQGNIAYGISIATTESFHWDFELNAEIDELKKVK